MRSSLYFQLGYFGLSKRGLYHGLSWFIMVYHGLSWLIMVYDHENSIEITMEQDLPHFFGPCTLPIRLHVPSRLKE
jgi:hypothetical protein